MSGYRSLHRQQVVPIPSNIENEQQQQQINTTGTTSTVGDTAVTKTSSSAGIGTTSSSQNVWIEKDEVEVAFWDIQTTTSTYTDDVNDNNKNNRNGTNTTTTTNNNNNNFWRIWAASSDGYIRIYKVQEKSIDNNGHNNNNNNKDTTTIQLDASALKLFCTHILVPQQQQQQQQLLSSSLHLGCTKIMLVRNSMSNNNHGTDGTDVVFSLDMAGTVRVWDIFLNNLVTTVSNDVQHKDTTTGSSNNKNSMNVSQTQEQTIVPAKYEFIIPNATGTLSSICPVSSSSLLLIHNTNTNTNTNSNNNNNDYNYDHTSEYDDVVVVAIGCLDGTIVFVSTGIPMLVSTPSTSNNNITYQERSLIPPGTILDTMGRSGTSIPLSMAWRDFASNGTGTTDMAIGRQDGTIDVFSIRNSRIQQQQQQQQYHHHHHEKKNWSNHYRLLELIGSPVRALTYTDDGQLLICGNDNGTISIYDVNRPKVAVIGGVGSGSGAVLVHHVLNAHGGSWILDVVPLYDNTRFVTLGMDQVVHVWKLSAGQLMKPEHTFQLDHRTWTIQRGPKAPLSLLLSSAAATAKHLPSFEKRIITASENGWIQIFSYN